MSTSVTAVVSGATTASNPRAAIEAAFENTQGRFKILVSVSTQDVFKPIDAREFVVEGKDIPLNYGIIYYTAEGFASNPYASFHVGETAVGKVIVTEVDSTNKLISGTFECRTAQKNSNEVIVLSEGSFTKIPYKE